MSRARGLSIVVTWWVATGVGFYVVGDHNAFEAIFGVFAVAAVTGVLTFAISLVSRLFHAIGGRS